PVDGLKGRAAPDAMINPFSERMQLERVRLAEKPPGPGQMAQGRVLLGPAPFEKRLRPAVVPLLTPIGLDGVAPAVPDHRRRAIAQRPPSLLEAPAEVDVVARNAELRIEAADCFQAFLAKGHV